MTGRASTSRVRFLWRMLSGRTGRDLEALVAKQREQIERVDDLIARIEEWQVRNEDARDA